MLYRNARQALRRLLQTPATTGTAVVTIALAFAANVAIFSVVDGVLLQDLPFEDPERLVRVLNHPEGNPDVTFEISYVELEQVRRGVRGLVDVGGHASSQGGLSVRVDDELQTLPAAMVSGNLFSLLGVGPIAGRAWVENDDRLGAEPVVAISERLFERVWNRDPRLLDSYLEIAGQKHLVTSILPAAFEYPPNAQMWIPVTSALPEALLTNAGTRFFNPIARLAPGVSPTAAVVEWNALVDATVDAQLPETARSEVSSLPLAESLFGAGRSTLLFLWGAAGLVLLIACANVANLQTVRTLARRRDVALRRALGASSLAIARLSLWEGLLMCVVGSALGTFLGVLAVQALLAAAPVALYRSATVSLDVRVWGFAVLLAGFTVLVIGLVPLLVSATGNLVGALSDGGTRSTGSRGSRTLLRGFVIAQTALAIVLILGAALLARSFVALANETPGFDRDRILSFSLVQTDGGPSPDAAQHDQLVDTLIERIQALPDVESSAGVLLRPLQSLDGYDTVFTIEGRPPEESASYPQLNYEAATPRYFETMGVPLFDGRMFTTADDEDAPGVALISAAVADRFFPDESPVGQRFKFGGADSQAPWTEIIGVVGDGRYRRMNEVSLNLFVPYRQTGWALNHLVVRSRHEAPATLATTVRQEVREAGLGVEATNIFTLDQVLHQSLAAPRFQTTLLAIFAGLALVLGAVGLYGVMSYLFAIRSQEIGVRLAIGAAPSDVFRLALGEALGLALLGTAVGLVAALALIRVLSSYLGETLHVVSTTDPLAMTITVSLFLSVATLAGLPPALRARKMDPARALS